MSHGCVCKHTILNLRIHELSLMSFVQEEHLSVSILTTWTFFHFLDVVTLSAAGSFNSTNSFNLSWTPSRRTWVWRELWFITRLWYWSSFALDHKVVARTSSLKHSLQKSNVPWDVWDVVSQLSKLWINIPINTCADFFLHFILWLKILCKVSGPSDVLLSTCCRRTGISTCSRSPSAFGVIRARCWRGWQFHLQRVSYNPANGWPKKHCVPMGRLGLCVGPRDFGRLDRGFRIKITVNSASGSRSSSGASFILTCAYALTASLACPGHPGSLDIAAKTSAAVICDSEAPCSVKQRSFQKHHDQWSLWVQFDHCIFQMSCPILSFSDDTNPWASRSGLVCLLSSLDVSLHVYWETSVSCQARSICKCPILCQVQLLLQRRSLSEVLESACEPNYQES